MGETTSNPIAFLKNYLPSPVALNDVLKVGDLGYTRKQAAEYIIDSFYTVLRDVKEGRLSASSSAGRLIIRYLTTIAGQSNNLDVRDLIKVICNHFNFYVPDRYKANYVAARKESLQTLADGTRESLSPRSRVLYDLMSNLDNHIIFEDRDLLILNKPPGVACYAGDGHAIGVLEVVRSRRSAGVELAHRLDRDTSGVLVMTKTDRGYQSMFAQFRGRERENLEKIYMAILDGVLLGVEDEIKIATHLLLTNDKTLIATEEEIKNPPSSGTLRSSLTIFRPVAILMTSYGLPKTLTEVKLITGRKHQIRAVSAGYLNCPILGDFLYNPNVPEARRQMLHARRLTFKHPVTGNTETVKAPYPDDFTTILKGMRWEC